MPPMALVSTPCGCSSRSPNYSELAANTGTKAEKAAPGTLEVTLATERDKEVFVERIFPVYTFTNCGID
jgi:hypothetical protein